MSQNTKLMAYSMTKTFIAILALQLHEQGKINIEDEVTKYLSDNPYGKKLKIKHLINQTSGIPNPIPLKWAHLRSKDKNFDEKEAFWIRVKENSVLDFTPGEKYSYSNISYAMLGQILEFVSKKPLAELFNEQIKSPLGISPNNLRFDYLDNEQYAVGYLKRWSFINFAKYFVVDSKMYSDYEDGWLRFNQHNVDYKAMGGLITNAESVAMVLQDILKSESKLLKPETKKLLFKIAKNNEGEEIEMTLGWHVGELHGKKFYFKEGGGAGFHCEMRIYPDKKLGSVVMTNSTTFDVKGFLNKVDGGYKLKKDLL